MFVEELLFIRHSVILDDTDLHNVTKCSRKHATLRPKQENKERLLFNWWVY